MRVIPVITVLVIVARASCATTTLIADTKMQLAKGSICKRSQLQSRIWKPTPMGWKRRIAGKSVSCGALTVDTITRIYTVIKCLR